MPSYIKHLPAPLIDDIIENRCIPFIGAGFSRNAVLPPGAMMPLWNGLAKSLGDQIPDFEYTDALDAISAFDHAYSRAKLVEVLGRLLHTETAQPGGSHKAFCSLPFEIVCSTNFDFLLERGYESVGRFCRPITDEDQLSTHMSSGTVNVLKFHGASDNLYLYENLEKRLPIAQTLDSASNLQAQERMLQIASSPRLVVPGHDPAVFVRFPTPGGGVATIR